MRRSIYLIVIIAFGFGINYLSNQKQGESLPQEITSEKHYLERITIPELYDEPREVEVRLVAEDGESIDLITNEPYADENGVLTYPYLTEGVPTEEGVCMDWVEDGECYLGVDAHIPDLVFKPNGHARPDRMNVVGKSVDFWAAMQQTALMKSEQQSYTREETVNIAMAEAVANEQGINGGRFLCSDDLCGAVFNIDNWDHWMQFIENSPLWDNEDMGNIWIIPEKLGSAVNLEIRVMTTPHEAGTMDAY